MSEHSANSDLPTCANRDLVIRSKEKHGVPLFGASAIRGVEGKKKVLEISLAPHQFDNPAKAEASQHAIAQLCGIEIKDAKRRGDLPIAFSSSNMNRGLSAPVFAIDATKLTAEQAYNLAHFLNNLHASAKASYLNPQLFVIADKTEHKELFGILKSADIECVETFEAIGDRLREKSRASPTPSPRAG